MASGFGVRALLLSLLAFGLDANALSYRSGGSYSVKPYFQYNEGFMRSYKPASSGYESSAPHGGSLNYGPSYAGGASSQNLKPAAAAPDSGSHGGPVDGYSPEGSVATFWSYPPIVQKPKPDQRQPYQMNPNEGVLQTKEGMWDIALPTNDGFESAVVSSRAIEIISRPESESKPQQPKETAVWDFALSTGAGPKQPGYPSKPQQPVYPSKPQQPGYPSKPQQPGYPSKPQQPGYPSKPQQPVYPSKPQQPVYPSKPQQPVYPSKPQQPVYPSKPQQPVYPSKPQQPVYPSKPQQPVYPSKPQQPVYPSKPQQPVYPSKPQQPVYPSKPQQPVYPSKPQQPVKAGLWDFALSPSPSKPQQPQQGVLQSKAGMWDIALSTGAGHKPPTYPSKPQQPVYPLKPQQPGNAGLWDFALSTGAGHKPPTYPSKPQQPVYPSKPQQPQQPVYPSKPQQPQQPVYPSKPQQPQQPVYPSKPQQPQQPVYPSKPQQPQQPVYPSKPQQGVLQSKAGMWDIAFSDEGGSPKSSRPIPVASLDHPRWKRPLASVYNRYGRH